jgi:ketosteroid isomerase-like protein
MADPKVELVRELLDRFNGDDPAAIYELLAEDFVAEIPPNMSAEPDVYEGHAGARRYLEAFDGLIDDVRFEALEYHVVGDRVIVEMVLKGRGAASGISVEQRAAAVHTVAGGKVTRIDPYPDVESAREALGV